MVFLVPNEEVDDEEHQSERHEQVLPDVETNRRLQALHPRELPSLPRLVKDGEGNPSQEEGHPVHRVPHPKHPHAATPMVMPVATPMATGTETARGGEGE